MLEIKYPFFKKDRILKIGMLENLRDFPRDVLDIFCKELSDGIVKGFNITVDKDIITISKGIVKYHGLLYVVSESVTIPYAETEKDVMIKLCFHDDVYSQDDKTTLIDINLYEDMNLLPNEIELGRFRLKKGAYLRSEYQDLYDFVTEYNTINIVHVKYAGQKQYTLNKMILHYFANAMLCCSLQDAIDFSFCMLCLNSQIIERTVIQHYIAYKTQYTTQTMSNAEIHKQLVNILEQTKTKNKTIHKKRNTSSRIIMD